MKNCCLLILRRKSLQISLYGMQSPTIKFWVTLKEASTEAKDESSSQSYRGHFLPKKVMTEKKLMIE